MKLSVQLFNFFCVTIFCTLLAASCRKTGTGENPVNPPVGNQGDSINADTISNHLRFVNATKKQGAIPKGPAGSSLKISFKDTLTLTELARPVNFLHKDTTMNVAGAYVQVHFGATGSTFYYDVPEVPDVASNDTVSVILIGIDPNGLVDNDGVPPAGGVPFEITIVPHDPNGQPLGEVTRPGKIGPSKQNNAGLCNITTQQLDYWDWEVSYLADPDNFTGKSPFLNNRYKLWGKDGQNIRGCCTNGQSDYTPNCDSVNFRFLNFQTFFNSPQETYKFFEGGSYAAMTLFLRANPDPSASNFCGNGPGVTEEKLSRYFKLGNWAVTPLADPQRSDTLARLIVNETSSTGGGGSDAARPSGNYILFVDCQLLILIKPQAEGGSFWLCSFYSRRSPDSPEWTPLV